MSCPSRFAVDFAVIKIDEALNRDDFEAELHALIDEQRAEVERTIIDSLEANREALSSTSLRERTR